MNALFDNNSKLKRKKHGNKWLSSSSNVKVKTVTITFLAVLLMCITTFVSFIFVLRSSDTTTTTSSINRVRRVGFNNINKNNNMAGLHIGKKKNYSEEWTVSNMWDELNCEEIFKVDRPIHSQTVWKNSRQLYKDIVGKESSSIIEIVEDNNNNNNDNNNNNINDNNRQNGFSIPVNVKQVPPKGRGIFALKDINIGELIWSTIKTARFKDGPSYRKFIFNLEDGLACDVLQWAYVQDMGHSDDSNSNSNGDGNNSDGDGSSNNDNNNDNNLRISVDLDEGCFCNGQSDDNEANMGCNEEVAKHYIGGCKSNYFALKDIKAGEEIICSYGEFAIVDGWDTFGL